MAVTLPPTPQPSTSLGRDEFIDAMDEFVAWMYTAVPEMDAAITALNLAATNGTSATSVAIGTGSKSFTANTGKSWVVGMTLKLANSATNWMLGEVSSYNPSTGALVVNVRRVMGSGTFASWTISLAPPEPQGSMVFLGSVDAASSAQVDIENAFNEYDCYRIIGTGIYFDAAATMALRVRLKIAGSYDVGNNYQANTVGYIQLLSDFASVGGVAAFTMDIFSPALARPKLITANVHQFGGVGGGIITGDHSGTGPLTGVRFFPSVNTITGGKFSLYGIKNA